MIKTERTQIHFLGDVLVEVASLNPKVPSENEKETLCLALGICGFHQSYFETNQTLNQFNRSVLLRDNSSFVVTIFNFTLFIWRQSRVNLVTFQTLVFRLKERRRVTSRYHGSTIS